MKRNLDSSEVNAIDTDEPFAEMLLCPAWSAASSLPNSRLACTARNIAVASGAAAFQIPILRDCMLSSSGFNHIAMDKMAAEVLKRSLNSPPVAPSTPLNPCRTASAQDPKPENGFLFLGPRHPLIRTFCESNWAVHCAPRFSLLLTLAAVPKDAVLGLGTSNAFPKASVEG